MPPGEFVDLDVQGGEVAVVAEDGYELHCAGGEVRCGVSRESDVGGVLGRLPRETLDAADTHPGALKAVGAPGVPERGPCRPASTGRGSAPEAGRSATHAARCRQGAGRGWHRGGSRCRRTDPRPVCTGWRASRRAPPGGTGGGGGRGRLRCRAARVPEGGAVEGGLRRASGGSWAFERWRSLPAFGPRRTPGRGGPADCAQIADAHRLTGMPPRANPECGVDVRVPARCRRR